MATSPATKKKKDVSGISPYVPTEISSRLQFPNEQLTNISNVSRQPDGDGQTSEPIVQYGYHVRAGQLAKSDIYGLKPCCGSWEELIFMSLGQKILQNPRFSQYLSEGERICIENRLVKQGDTGTPTKVPGVDPNLVGPQPLIIVPGTGSGSGSGSGSCQSSLSISSVNSVSEEGTTSVFTLPYSSTWKVHVRITRVSDGVLVYNNEQSISGTEVSIAGMVFEDGQLYNLYQSYTDANECQYCFTLLNIDNIEEGTGNIDIPLRTGDCPSFDLGSDRDWETPFQQ